MLVGTAGAPISSEKATTFHGVARVKELRLDAMEVEFTYGVRMGKETARLLGNEAKQLGIALSAHGPYYVNLNAREDKKVHDSVKRIMETADRVALFEGRDVVYHAGFYLGQPAGDVYKVMKARHEGLVQAVKDNGWNVRLCPETTGKATQFGSWQELMRLCSEVDGLGMTFDFAHALARTNGVVDYHEIFSTLEKELGRKFLNDMHAHFSGIEYTEKGEKRHLDADDAFLKRIADTIKEFRLGGMIISESPNIEGDAIKLKKLLG
jgi:deoxyribonuclease-4